MLSDRLTSILGLSDRQPNNVSVYRAVFFFVVSEA
jgi:hypothetical protein